MPPTKLIRWQTTRRNLIFSVIVFFLSWINSSSLLSSSSLGRLGSKKSFSRLPHLSAVGNTLPQDGGKSRETETAHAKADIRVSTKANADGIFEDADYNELIGFRSKNYSSLQKVTEDLLDVNRTIPGSWTQQDCDKVVKVINMWSKRTPGPGRPRPPVQQELLLKRIIVEKHSANAYALDMNMRDIYHEIIFSWSKSHYISSISRAEEILDAMQHSYNTGQDGDLQPTLDAWNCILGAYAQSKSKSAQENTIRVFKKLDSLISDGLTDVRPNDASYAHLLRAVAGTNKYDAPKHVLELLIRMQNLSENGFAIEVTSACHNIYLNALVESMKDPRVSPPKIARLAESHLHKMKQNVNPDSKPDRRSYNEVIAGWSRSGDYDLVRKAETLLEEMEASTNQESSRIGPNKYTYDSIIFCYKNSNLPDKADKALAILEKMKGLAVTNSFCRPDCKTYNTVMNCVSKSKHPSAPYQVEKLLEELIDVYKCTGFSSMRPTNKSFNACVNAWARSEASSAPERINYWISRFQDDFESGRSSVRPNKWTYNSYLQALAKQRKPSSADEAERILDMMEQKSQDYGSNKLKPDVLTYTNVLHCIALSESPDSFQRAYAILSKMENGDGDVRPNAYTYNVLINVVAKSKQMHGKARISIQLLNRMKEVAIRPITITYNNALNACAYSSKGYDDKKEVIQVATMLLKEARETTGANYISYLTYVRVIRFFVDDRLEQWRLIRKAFRQCCEDGQLTGSFMQQIKPLLTPNQYNLIEGEANDRNTGRWHEDYTKNARLLKAKT